MKILIISNYANGLILFRKEVVSSFIENGDSVVISVPLDENCSKLESLGARVVASHLERRGMNPLKDFRLLLEYCKLLKTEKPDVVLTYTIKPNLYGSLASAIKKVPYMMNITGLGTALENPGLLGKILLAFYKLVTAKAKFVFFQNSGNMKFMQDRGIAKRNSNLLPGSGVNLEEHPFAKYPSEENGIRILAVLRIMKDKGIEEYFTAAQIISAKYPHVSFELVGEYEEDSREKYEPMIHNLESQGILKYYGHIDNVPEVMANNHIIVHPSYHEGLSNVCLEAAACGRPVLTTDVAGCRETIISDSSANINCVTDILKNTTNISSEAIPSSELSPSISGILFPARSSDALVSAVETALSYSPEQREQMGISGRKYIECHFSRQIVVDIYQKAVHDL